MKQISKAKNHNQDDSSEKEKVKQTYYTQRKDVKYVKETKNVYDMIKQLELGNLSSYRVVPTFYIKCLVSYILQISRAFSHCHKHDLVHGNFNLLKVLVQKLPKNVNIYDNLINDIKGRQKSYKFDQEKDNFDFHVTNFEPQSVWELMMVSRSKNENYQNLTKIPGMNLDYDSILQIVKVKDL